jgi:hypothetical protein
MSLFSFLKRFKKNKQMGRPIDIERRQKLKAESNKLDTHLDKLNEILDKQHALLSGITEIVSNKDSISKQELLELFKNYQGGPIDRPEVEKETESRPTLDQVFINPSNTGLNVVSSNIKDNAPETTKVSSNISDEAAKLKNFLKGKKV